MPKDTSIKKVLVIGSGPIVIGQAAEFDYAGTQACRVLKQEGVEIGAGQLQPCHHHDRQRHGGRSLSGTSDQRNHQAHHPEGRSRTVCWLAWAVRPV